MKKVDCPDCKGRIITQMYETYCEQCGLVLEDQPFMDDDRTFDGLGNIKNSRTGPPRPFWKHMEQTTFPKYVKKKTKYR